MHNKHSRVNARKSNKGSTLLQSTTQGDSINEKRRATSKNYAGEAPEGDSNQDRSALCNAGDPD
jgi:hypothetical protein